MNTKQIVYVLTIAHEGSFSNVADTLNIIQPSLSQYMMTLTGTLSSLSTRRLHEHYQVRQRCERYFTVPEPPAGLTLT
jgi:hypothetical protein